MATLDTKVTTTLGELEKNYIMGGVMIGLGNIITMLAGEKELFGDKQDEILDLLDSARIKMNEVMHKESPGGDLSINGNEEVQKFNEVVVDGDIHDFKVNLGKLTGRTVYVDGEADSFGVQIKGHRFFEDGYEVMIDGSIYGLWRSNECDKYYILDIEG
jgi:hypothetical protein